MKAKIKKTGEVVETMYQDCNCCYCEFPNGGSRFIPVNELEYLKPAELIDWEQRRYEIAKGVLSTLASYPEGFRGYGAPMVKKAIDMADELIKQLK